MSEWTRVKDGLPDDSRKLVLVFIKSAPGVFMSGDVMCLSDDDFKYVTHWQPLPAPPEVES